MTTTQDFTLSLIFPANAVSQTITLTVGLTGTHPITIGFRLVGSTFYIEAVNSNGARVTTFDAPYTLTLHYHDEDWQNAGLADETSLNLAYWAGSRWVMLLPCAGCNVNPVDNVVTVVVNHLTEFALVGTPYKLYLPLVVSQLSLHIPGQPRVSSITPSQLQEVHYDQ